MLLQLLWIAVITKICFAEDGRSKMVIETKPIELSTALKVKEIKTSKTSTSEIVYEKLPKPKSQEIIRYIRKDGTVIDHLVYDDVTTTWEHAYDYCKKSGAHLGSFEDEDESSYVMVTHNRRNCKSSCDTGYIWRSSTTEEDSAASKEILEKLESWSNKQKPEHGTIVNCPIVAMSGYLGEDNCLLDSYEEGLGFVCSERIAKLPSRPKSSAPDTTKEGVTHKRKNGTVAHFHVVTGRVTSERVARNECAEIGYELARFTDESEEQFIIEQFQRRHCPYCFGAYRVDWHGAGTKCKKLSFRHKSQMYTGCKRPTARKLKRTPLDGYICSKVLGTRAKATI